MSMDRRDFLKTTALGSSLGAIVTAGLLAEVAGADHHETTGGMAQESQKALAELRDAIAEIDAGFSEPAWRITTPGDLVDARSSLLHSLQHGLEVFLQGDAARPNFKRFVTPEKKLLGDNPDAIYYHTLVDAEHSYRVRGNIAGATYTSFTVELGTADGSMSTGTGATLNDTEIEIAADGSYEIIVSANKQPGNWLRLPESSGSLTTRHYYEREVSIAADRLHHVPLVIEPLQELPPPTRATDARLATAVRRVTKSLRTTIQPIGTGNAMPSYVSKIPNQLPAPEVNSDNTNTGFAAVDNVYSMAPFMLKPGEALVIRGRFPKCRFANVVLWNRYLQTLDYAHRTTSLNRKQTALESDGSFKIVLAGSDPGVPNWLDTEGRPFGMMFWRFLMPDSCRSPRSPGPEGC
ncbi:MAG: DUF1214 domain-containing protein [Deltaproteobacteria bacterium]|nr:DUF1214 domain-containing protein [Deltaproteobacteria bacterium]